MLLLGGIGVVDLRLTGLIRRVPIEPLLAALTPLAITGLLLLVASGAVMFAADARSLVANPMFLRKLVMIALGLANAALFALLWRRRVAGWYDRVPAGARAAGFASLIFWLLAAAFGRLIAYV
ncbi:hypothetical protein ACFOMD_06395 [Sphingoaurantiacus capsulatus]|uniref:DUF2214 domain-containing protein n=1 Tax=Sphingoaurantiacus capsulatus TaxID=1771310 RepID=A0ABV7X9S1_9SPHN